MASLRFQGTTFVATAMKVFKCSKEEAEQWLSNPADKAFLFSSGEVYIPPSWNRG